METLAGPKLPLQWQYKTRSKGGVLQNGVVCDQASLTVFPCSGRRGSLKRRSSFRLQVACEKKATVLAPPLKQLTLSEPKVEYKYVKAFAPATVANLGPGFDFLGCAVDGLGDYVTAEVFMYVLVPLLIFV